MKNIGTRMQISEISHFDIVRTAVAHATYDGWRNVPHVSGTYEPDITEFLRTFKKYKLFLKEKHSTLENDHNSYPRVSFNVVMAKVIAEGLKAAPRLNALLEYSKIKKTGTLKILGDVNISMPFLFPDGKMVSLVIPKVQEKSIIEIASYMDKLNRKAKNTNLIALMREVSKQEQLQKLKAGRIGVLPSLFMGLFSKNHKVPKLKGSEREEYERIGPEDKLTPNDVMNGSIVVSNIGSVYRNLRGSLNILDILPPQVCAIGISSIRRIPLAIKDPNGAEKIEIRDVVPLCVVFDHRANDFFEVIKFIRRLDEIFADPESFFKMLFGAQLYNAEGSTNPSEISSA